MTHIRKITNTLAAVALACLTLTSTACSDDDDNSTPDPDKQEQGQTLTLQDAVGSYTGTFDFTSEPSTLNPAPQSQNDIAVSLEVTEEGAVHFAEFPAATLVTALLGEEAAGSLIDMLGTITYDATIGTPTADATKLSAALTTPALTINLMGGMMKVEITIESPEQLTYTKEGGLTFTLKTTKASINGEEMELVNTLTFDVKK